MAEEDEGPKPKRKLPLGYTPLPQAEIDGVTGDVIGWRQIFDSESDNFNMVIGLVIVMNAIVIGLETDLGRTNFVIFEHIFNTCFVIEMLTRVLQIGSEYFTSPAYLFDLTLVVTGSLDLWILPAVAKLNAYEHHSGVGYQFSVLRLLRMLRLMRVLRVVRLFRMFNQLLLIIRAFGKALQVVMLLGVLVIIMLYAVSIVLTQMIGHKMDQFGDRADEVEYWFGSIGKSMTTLFWVMFGSSWDPLLDLLTTVYPYTWVLTFFAGYMIINVAMLALVIGLISESLIIAQEEYRDKKLAQFAVKKKNVAADYTGELSELLEDEMDEFGCVEASELKGIVKGDASLIQKLTTVGITITPEGLTTLVDNMTNEGAQRCSIDHFIEKLTNLSGVSAASAVCDVKYDLLKNRQKWAQIDGKLEKLGTMIK